MTQQTDRQPLPTAYEPKSVEAHWRKFWVDSQLTHAARDPKRPSFSLVIPPPNVTGRLHMGHALVQTVQDVIIRFMRMRHYDVMWVPGTDHAGIATQSVVERHLFSQKGIRRSDMKREEFVDYCWKWKEEYEASILDQVKLVGCSCDWSMKAFTMDEPRSKAVRTAFKRLYDKGLIYRGDYLVNWDPVSQTALADDELEYEERQGFIWQIKYPLLDGGFIEIATTRPETILGDTAIAVHPNDTRYQALIGKKAVVPFINRQIEIIADGFVDPEFGTGAVKITPGHDTNDYQMALRHNLPMINLLHGNGTLNEQAGVYCGLSLSQARERIVQDLEALSLLVKAIPHVNRVAISYRSKATIEPMLSKQWFMKLSAFKTMLRNAVESKKIELIPQVWENTYFHWIDNLRDWCISRQLWWGHRIPVWYRKDDPDTILCHDGDDLPKEVAANPELWTQDSDVLDTWFSSSLWPLSVMGWPDRTFELERYYPTSVLVTGHDILFFWVARMILMGELMEGQFPFSKVYLHGLIFAKSYWRQPTGGAVAYVSGEERLAYDSGKPVPKDVHSRWEKMSKSKGNVIDPVEVIDTYGADAMRMALASSLGDARQIDLDRRRFEEYKNFANKLFNSARFVFMNIDQEPALSPEAFSKGIDREILLTEDRWILERYQTIASKVTESLEKYEFAAAASLGYTFFWDEFCAYYLEISKPVLWGKAGTSAQRVNKQKVLSIVLCGSLRLLHPFTPFITEELMKHLKDRLAFAQLTPSSDPLTQEAICALQAPCCMVSPFPQSQISQEAKWCFPQAIEQMQILQEVIYRVRSLRAEMKIQTGHATDLLLSGTDEELQLLQTHEYVLRALLPLKEIKLGSSTLEGQLASSSNFGTITLTVPLPLEMAAADHERCKKQALVIQENIELLQSRLSSESFVAKAPAHLVEKQRAQLLDMQQELTKLHEQIKKLEKLLTK